jgi:hypothetical protein
MAQLVQSVQRPTLVLAPNKTLAAQLYQEVADLFPENAVEYFISYYDYYQPEAYIPGSDTYIEKDATVNDQIDRMRNKATASLLPPRCPDRRQRLLHLRPRFARRLPRHGDHAAQGRRDRPGRAAAFADPDPVPAQPARLRARQLPRAWRRRGGLPRSTTRIE